ncbi:MAG: enoyl-CoA hydratase/isomerase family protein [Gammaproteobacteria bacterium]|nr:enoyl-CoA hydratase/isomerase family protein [Gammaproteobacteria bacterium]
MGDHYPRVWKPVIAAVNGWAAGAGLYTLLASTDIRIASAENAKFKFALTSQGWLGHGPGASLLIKQLRYIDAMKILLTDLPFDAPEALRIGLINEIVPHADLMTRAEEMARHICTLPPVADPSGKKRMRPVPSSRVSVDVVKSPSSIPGGK